MAITQETYVVDCRRSPDGWWAIAVPAVPGVYSQARRLDQVEMMARDALSLMLEVPDDSFAVEIHRALTPLANDAVMRLEKARRTVEDAQRDLAYAATAAAVTLVNDMHLTVRDAGKILGVSHQRVDQLLHREPVLPV